MTAELWPWDRRLLLFDMVIRNYGTGAARDIRVVWDPDFRQPQYQGGTMNEFEIMKNLPFLAPNDEIVFFAGRHDWLNADDLPDIWQGTVFYKDDLGDQETVFKINRKQWDRLKSNLPGDGPRVAPPIRRGWAPVEQWEKPNPPPQILG